MDIIDVKRKEFREDKIFGNNKEIMSAFNVILGVTGSISAYKACDIISGLNSNSINVKVVMTENAKRFITEETLAVLSHNKVYSDTNRDLDGKVSHIELAKWANLMIIAPCTANTIAKLEARFCDNFLLSVAMAMPLSNGVKNIIAPAMNPNMWAKCAKSTFSGWKLIDPVFGMAACGDIGVGKLESPRKIVQIVLKELGRKIDA